MVKIKIYIALLLVATIAYSCTDSNKIYFEIQEQSIKSCNRKGISGLYIQNDKTSEMYYFIFNDTLNNEIPKTINIDSINKLYSIFHGWQKKLINKKLFKLAPLSQYSIERVQGDASAYKIKIWTDENSKVIRSSKESCEN